MDCTINNSYRGGFDFEALKFSGVAAVLPAAFFSYHGFSNKQLKNAGLPRTDQPNSFWFWEKYHFFSVSTFIKSTNCVSLHIFIEFYAPVHPRIIHDIHNIKVV